MGILFDKTSKDLKTPFWRGFKRDIDKSVKPAIVGFGVTFGHVIKGAAGVIDAFLPHIDDIADRMVKSSGKFADWGTKLKGSPQFENFLKYADEHGPLIAQTLGSIAGAFLAIGAALSPISGPLLHVIGAVADGIASVADTLPWLIQLIYGVWVATKVWTIAMAAFNLVMAANPIVLIFVGIVALVAAVIYAYKHLDWFRNLVQAVWQGIQTAALWAWTNVLKPTFDAIWAGIKVVGDVAVWLWKNVFVPAWSVISTVARIAAAVILTLVVAPLVIAFNLIAGVLTWLWKTVFKPAFEDMATVAKWLWEKALSPFFTSAWNGVKYIGDKFAWLYDHIIKPFAGWIADKAKWLWDKGIKPSFQNLWDGIKWVGDKFKWLYDHMVSPAVDNIADGAKWLYNKGLKPAFDNIKSAVGLLGDAFGDAKRAIKRSWDQIAGIAARPVNFIVDAVYTNGIKAVWDRVAKFVGLDALPKAPKLLDEAPKFANGGRTSGGIPGVDSIPILAMADEFIIKRSSARKIGFDKLAYMNATGEIPRFANGGLVGGVIDWGKGAIDKGIDWTRTAGDVALHPGKAWDRLMKGVLSHVTDGGGSSPMGQMLARLPIKIADRLRDAIVDGVTGGGGDIGGSIPSGKRRSIISQAMAAAHVPPPGTEAQWLAGLNTLIQRESAWNPNAINRTDINARNGVPSQGLAQVIPPTFKANHVAGTSWNILDPVANVAAAIRYITHRYGNITNVQQANSHLPPKRYALGGRVTPTWYDDGGYLPKGLSLVANGTGRPEPVMTSQQWGDLRAARGSSSTPNVVVENHTYLGTDEITDILDHRIVVREQQNAADINTGRWV
ncbi:transglycosylase SLT domain-containing protein [Streptomyces sp. NPDC101151]|uniref:transglycosylase SLT domain-containing protein n=1 Tax=Streptomyces sp. NPDC101151 TaxID=3366115 RepID=UPI00382F5C55